MKNLIIIGAGSFGREIQAWLPNCSGFNTEWKFKGFLDNEYSRLDNYDRSNEILGLSNEYIPVEDDVFLCSIADIDYKKRYVEYISSKNGRFINVIHNTSCVDPKVIIGSGVFVAPFCTISCDVKIGNHTLFNSYAAVGHDVKIGDYCHINSFVLLGGFAILSDGVTVHPNSVILPGKKVGENSIVGAGSIVIRNVPPHITVFGNPAKRL